MTAIELRIDRGNIPTLPGSNEHLLSVWLSTLRKAAEAHLRQIELENIKINGPVVLTLEQFKCTAKGLMLDRDVRLTLTATVDGQEKNARLHVTLNLNPRRKGHRMTGDITESMMTIRDTISGAHSVAALTEELVAGDRFFSDVTVRALEKLDYALGRSGATEVTLWRYAQYGGWAATAIALTVPLLAIDGPMQARLMVSAMIGFVVYFLTYAIAVCCMPARFFENYGAGKRVMRFAGTSTGEQTLRTVRIATVLLICGLAAAASVMINISLHEQ
jgi:hypothetical protein